MPSSLVLPRRPQLEVTHRVKTRTLISLLGAPRAAPQERQAGRLPEQGEGGLKRRPAAPPLCGSLSPKAAGTGLPKRRPPGGLPAPGGAEAAESPEGRGRAGGRAVLGPRPPPPPPPWAAVRAGQHPEEEPPPAWLPRQAGGRAGKQAGAMLQFLVRLRGAAAAAPPFRAGRSEAGGGGGGAAPRPRGGKCLCAVPARAPPRAPGRPSGRAASRLSPALAAARLGRSRPGGWLAPVAVKVLTRGDCARFWLASSAASGRVPSPAPSNPPSAFAGPRPAFQSPLPAERGLSAVRRRSCLVFSSDPALNLP